MSIQLALSGENMEYLSQIEASMQPKVRHGMDSVFYTLGRFGSVVWLKFKTLCSVEKIAEQFARKIADLRYNTDDLAFELSWLTEKQISRLCVPYSERALEVVKMACVNTELLHKKQALVLLAKAIERVRGISEQSHDVEAGDSLEQKEESVQAGSQQHAALEEKEQQAEVIAKEEAPKSASKATEKLSVVIPAEEKSDGEQEEVVTSSSSSSSSVASQVQDEKSQAVEKKKVSEASDSEDIDEELLEEIKSLPSPAKRRAHISSSAPSLSAGKLVAREFQLYLEVDAHTMPYQNHVIALAALLDAEPSLKKVKTLLGKLSLSALLYLYEVVEENVDEIREIMVDSYINMQDEGERTGEELQTIFKEYVRRNMRDPEVKERYKALYDAFVEAEENQNVSAEDAEDEE